MNLKIKREREIEGLKKRNDMYSNNWTHWQRNRWIQIRYDFISIACIVWSLQISLDTFPAYRFSRMCFKSKMKLNKHLICKINAQTWLLTRWKFPKCALIGRTRVSNTIRASKKLYLNSTNLKQQQKWL